MSHSLFLASLSLLSTALLHYRPVNALDCFYCSASGKSAEYACKTTQYKAQCNPGTLCYSRRIEKYGKTTSFERSCEFQSECKTECLSSGVCTYCCDKDFCNSPQNDKNIPGSVFSFTSTDTIVLIAGCAIAVLILIVVATLFVRWQANRRHRLQTLRSRRSNGGVAGDEDFSLIGNDENQLLGEDRINAGLPPTYDEALEEPPAYQGKEDDDDKSVIEETTGLPPYCRENSKGDEREE